MSEQDITSNTTYNTDNSHNSGVINTGNNSGTMQVVGTDNSVFNNINYDELAAQLSTLRQELRSKSDGSVEHDEAVYYIGQAEKAAKEKDPSKIMQFLKAAGKWTLDVAKDLGVEVAAKLIEHSIGIS